MVTLAGSAAEIVKRYTPLDGVTLVDLVKGAFLNFQKDHYFRIGTLHEKDGLPCQDYAFSGVSPNNIHYAIVADGCSASEDSDIGSRWITHWFRNFLETYPSNFPANPEEYGEMEIATLIEDFHRVHMGDEVMLPHGYCTDTTLVAAFMHRAFDEGYVLMIGDGAFSIRDIDGTLRSYLISVDGNCPPYLSYHVDQNRLAQYIMNVRARELKLNIVEHDSEKNAFDVLEPIPLESIIARAGVVFRFNPKTTDMIGVFTDGVDSFNEPWHNVMAKLMDVKTFEGNFITRTCLGSLRRMVKEGVNHYDDLSMAAIKITHPEESVVNDKTSTEEGEPAANAPTE